MNEHRSIQCPAGSGGESDERLFTEQTQCAVCKEWFNDDSVVDCPEVHALACVPCAQKKEQEFNELNKDL
jgi:hypothetical protein